MMKEKYELTTLDIIVFETEDIITDSGESSGSGQGTGSGGNYDSPYIPFP